MVTRDKLPKVGDAEREALYGYVFGVSGPGMMRKKIYSFHWTILSVYLSRYG